MKVAVIVLNYNSSSDCAKCIGYLLKQEEVELDIIVVDNCSSVEDRTNLESILSNFTIEEKGCHVITYISNNVNKGYNAGNNIGLRYADEQGYQYALVANPDMEFPLKDYVSDMVCIIDKMPDVVVLGSDIINNEGLHQNPQRETSYYEEFFWPIQLIKSRNNKLWNTLDHTRSCFCDKVSGCCIILRMSFVHSINYFDENVFLYSEESILGKQVCKSGFKMFYVNSLYAIHRHNEQKKGDVKPRMKALFKSRWYYLKTYSGYSQLALSLLKLSKQIQKFLFV